MPRPRYEQLLPELARRLSAGESYPTIASALDISPSTVGRFARRQETKDMVAQLVDCSSPVEITAVQVLRSIMVGSADERLRAHCAELCLKYRIEVPSPPQEPEPEPDIPSGYRAVVLDKPIK